MVRYQTMNLSMFSVSIMFLSLSLRALRSKIEKEVTVHSRGFTLIELLVVIAIMGILSSVVLASINSARASARDALRLSDLRQLQSVLELFYQDNTNQYPCVSSGSRVDTMNTSCRNLLPYYPNGLPTDPIRTGSDGYRYYPNSNVAGARTSYTLLVKLERNGNSWCSINFGPGYSGWNGNPSDGGGNNYPPCY